MIKWVVGVGVLIRLFLILYGEWQDSHFSVKYTDVDYRVLSDGSKSIAQGNSPYERSTYRYTPLFAYLLLPSIFSHPFVGKLIFGFADLLVSLFTFWILQILVPKNQSQQIGKYVALWLLNPIVVNVSTRGNAEALISLFVIAAIYFCLTNRIFFSAVCLGISIHLKMYPLIYLFPLALFVSYVSLEGKKGKKIELFWTFSLNFLYYSLITAFTLLVLGVWMYGLYGWEFLEHSYLYHFTRVDHRHNFSLYFYSLYLAGTEKNIMGLAAFLPQAILMLLFPFSLLIRLFSFSPSSKKEERKHLERNLVFCFFLQTVTFVAFNKVCTVQYFVWYFAFLPFVAPFSMISLSKALSLSLLWLFSQILWLGLAYLLEFQALDTFIYLWIAGSLFFFSHIYILQQLISSWTPTKNHQI